MCRKALIRILVRRRWFVLLPLALGLTASALVAMSESVSTAAESLTTGSDSTSARTGLEVPSASLARGNGMRESHVFAGAVGGLGVGLMLVVWMEFRNRGLECEEDVERALTLPVLGSIGVLRSEHGWRSQRIRQRTLDVVGCLLLIAAGLFMAAVIY